MLQTARVLVALIAVALAFQLFFRYQYIGTAPIVMRVDRVTGASCFMPCRPTPVPSPKAAPIPPNYAEDDQRAIALAQRQPSAIAIEAQYANSGYEWTTEGRYTSDYVYVRSPQPNVFDAPTDCKPNQNPFLADCNPVSATPDIPRPYGWTTPSPEPTNEPPAPVRVVCLCSRKGFGWRWEVHLDTREVYEVDGNRDLEERYGLHSMPTPSPASRNPFIQYATPSANVFDNP
jgi:hypothetical protein